MGERSACTRTSARYCLSVLFCMKKFRRYVGVPWLLLVVVCALLLANKVECKSQKTFASSTFLAHRIDSLGRRDSATTIESPNWLTLVPGFGSSGFLPAHIQSAPGSGYVARDMHGPKSFGPSAEDASDVAFSLWHTLIGHCDVGSTPCTKPGVDRVLGCCPAGQVCAYLNGNSNVFMACVDDIRQECHDQRCNPGYVCCPGRRDVDSRCVPDLGDIEASCGRSILYRSSLYTGHAGETLEKANDFTRKHRVFPIPKPLAYVGAFTLFRGTNTTVDAVLEIFRCSVSGDWCAFADECVAIEEPLIESYVVNGTEIFYSNSTESVPAVCCLTDWTPCFSPTLIDPVPVVGSRSNAVRPVGCADTLGGEVCCGKAICPVTAQCCVAPPRSTPGSLGVSQTGVGGQRTECCSTTDQCCFSEERGLYCGKSVNGVDCAADARGPPVWYIQDGPLNGQLLPL